MRLTRGMAEVRYKLFEFILNLPTIFKLLGK